MQVDKLNALNCELSAGTSAVVALVYRGRLYVANVGDSRALLCKTDSNQVLRVVQLSVDHDLRNEDELLRLSQLGLDIESIRQGKFDIYISLVHRYLLKKNSDKQKHILQDLISEIRKIHVASATISSRGDIESLKS